MRFFKSLTIATVAAVCGSAHGAVNYWDFNVFSRGEIGAPGHGYGSQFAGASGAVGDAWFTNFGARTNAGASPSLPGGFYGGGDFTLGGAVHSGGVFVEGDVKLSNASITGDVAAGGDIGGSSGSVTGNVVLGGKKNAGNQLTITGSLSTFQTVTMPVSMSDASAYFSQFSSSAGALGPTTSYTNSWGNLIINASGPLTVVDLAKSDFQSAWGITINGPGTVILNMDGASMSFASKTWTYQGGASSAMTLLNMPEATSVQMSGGHNVNILAPNAITSFTSGTVTGNLIVGGLTGSGSAAWNGGFGGASALQVPAPSGAGALLAGAGLLGVRRRRELSAM